MRFKVIEPYLPWCSAGFLLRTMLQCLLLMFAKRPLLMEARISQVHGGGLPAAVLSCFYCLCFVCCGGHNVGNCFGSRPAVWASKCRCCHSSAGTSWRVARISPRGFCFQFSLRGQRPFNILCRGGHCHHPSFSFTPGSGSNDPKNSGME